MKFYLVDTSEVLKELKTANTGLSSAEASERLASSGKNKLQGEKKHSTLYKFFIQMRDPMIIVLLAAAALSMVTALFEGESFTDVFIILFVVVLNSVLGVVQESKADRAIEALKALSADTIMCYRDGALVEVPSENLVTGDVIQLSAGDSVPADGRLIESHSVKVQEAALTGESVPVEKNEEAMKANEDSVSLGDRHNMVYTGTSVVYGHGLAVVVSVGMDTEMGKIAQQIHSAEKRRTPLQKRLDQLSRVLTYGVLAICAFIFIFSLATSSDITPDVIIETSMLAISLAVAAIPEGLVAVVTIVLSIGVTKMSERHAIVRKINAVETLGCTQIICSDKTGTLTQNKMKVISSHGDNNRMLAQVFALCNNAKLSSSGEITGEPTEAALLSFSLAAGVDKNVLVEEMPRLAEIPFSSARKMMTTFNSSKTGEITQFVKGAPGVVLSRCDYILKDGKIVVLDEKQRTTIDDLNKTLASRSLRVMAGAFKKIDKVPEDLEDANVERSLVYIGLVGMSDPIRPEALGAIKECKHAGIRPIMITGDHLSTASAIAKSLGILEGTHKAITGAQLDKISDSKLSETVEDYSVYARVQPIHKVRIVKAWKNHGRVTAMTGDGVNDAPAIKNADIGIGMGITGTDVTKNIADIVLADDNFATIVAAIEEGRRIYDNIRRTIQFLLSSNLSEVLLILTATLIGFSILNPVQLLWINLVTDMLPALALGMEFAEPNLMDRLPRKETDGIFADGLGFACIYQGILIASLSFTAYLVGGTSMAFVTISMCQAFQAINMRSLKGSIFKLPTHNKYLYLALLAALILTIIPVYVPFITASFGLQRLTIFQYISAVGIGFAIIPLLEIVKYIHHRRYNN